MCALPPGHDRRRQHQTLAIASLVGGLSWTRECPGSVEDSEFVHLTNLLAPSCCPDAPVGPNWKSCTVSVVGGFAFVMTRQLWKCSLGCLQWEDLGLLALSSKQSK